VTSLPVKPAGASTLTWVLAQPNMRHHIEYKIMIGLTISHYRIKSKLGEGGMGAVYSAEDLKLGRDVALKFLPETLASDAHARRRLLVEAKLASRLNHPHIATIYEVNDSEGAPFLAMELVHGETLKQVLNRGALEPIQLLEIARQIAEGLREAHQAGVIHHDIKPGNIMLDSRSRVKILDFGLAVLTGRERSGDETVENFVTRTSTQASTGGTVPYMAPEQLRGEATDCRCDIFSFGVMLYECLTGRLPFRGETSIDVLHAILRDSPVPLRSLIPEIAAEWEQLIERCLAKSPAQRFASMGEILDALNGVAAPALQPEKSVMVLYFENLSGAKEEEYFRDGMTEDIITELSKIGDLRVFPRSAALPYRDKPVPAPQVGRDLGAAYVLEGSVRRAGSRLRITAQLAQTRTGHSVWAERFDRNLEDVFAIQDEIAQSIARALRVMLTEKEKRAIEKIETTEVQAYDYYLRGLQFIHAFRRKSLDYARQMFARAIVLDPNYARAFAGVADCCSFMYMYFEASEANLKEADSASRRAIELDPESAEGHTSRGLALSLRKDFEAAEREFEIAIHSNPNLYEAYYFYGRACFAAGKMEEAARWFGEAVRVNPDDYQARSLRGLSYRALGQVEKCIESRRDALRVIERHVALHPDDARAIYMGANCLSELGQRELSLQWAARALAVDPEESSILYNVACNYALNNEPEKALDCLESAVRNGFGHKAWIENDPDFKVIRSHPRYQALIASM
jgi:serine/threonine protein kinase/tetratricopeptide (TPR) repeat protein